MGSFATDVKVMDECSNAICMLLLRQSWLEVAHGTALAPARRLQMEWRNNTIPLLSSQSDTMAWKKTVQPWKCKSIWVLALNIQLYGLRSYGWYFNSFKLCRSLCIEVHMNGIMHNVRQSFGLFNGCNACQVCHRQACLPASKFEKERYDLSVNASHPIVQVQRQYQPRCWFQYHV